MANIIALTAPHLNGMIFRILQDEDQTADVLKAVYAAIWDTRQGGTSSPDLLNALRAIAHRFAMNYKYTGRTGLDNDRLAELRTGMNPSAFNNSILDHEDAEILKTAYLAPHAKTKTKKPTTLSNDNVREKIKDIVSKMTRDLS